MTVNIETAIAWMKGRQGQVYYSMEDRDGPDSYDCSSSVYYALRSAGAVSAGWAVNTENERPAWRHLYLGQKRRKCWSVRTYWYVH